MKIAAIVLSLITVILIGIGLAKPENFLQPPLAYQIAMGTAALSLVMQFLNKSSSGPAARVPRTQVAQATQASATATSSEAPKQAEAEVISFLAALQEKGRLVDFLMDDVTTYDDSQVGAAARVVHEGCRTALNDCFNIVPVSESPEGTTISVPESHRADEYRLTGKLSGQPPFNGTPGPPRLENHCHQTPPDRCSGWRAPLHRACRGRSSELRIRLQESRVNSP